MFKYQRATIGSTIAKDLLGTATLTVLYNAKPPSGTCQ